MPKRISKKAARNNTAKSTSKRDKEYYNAILLEEIRGQMKTVIEVVENSRDISEQRDNEIREEMNAQFEIVKSAIRHNSQNIQILKTDVHVLKTDVHVLKTDVKEVQVEMHQMENRLSDKIDRIGNRVDNHEVRITNLETARL